MKKPERSDAFRSELESLQKEFEAYLSTMLSVKTIRNHSHVVGLFIDYVCFDCRIQRFQDITRGTTAYPVSCYTQTIRTSA